MFYERITGILPDRANNSSAFRDRYHHSLPPDAFLFFLFFCSHVAKFLKTLRRTDTCYVLEKYIYIFIYMRVRFTAYDGIRLAPQFLI